MRNAHKNSLEEVISRLAKLPKPQHTEAYVRFSATSVTQKSPLKRIFYRASGIQTVISAFSRLPHAK